MKRLTIVMLSLMLIVTLNFSKAISAQTDKATLTPEAEQALNRGLAATRQQDWDLAIKYFKEAQKASPLAPETIFNLALAYDKADGCDLFAAAYYRAYLVAVPEEEDKDKIEARINELVLHAKATTTQLIRDTTGAYYTISKIYGNPKPGGGSNDFFYIIVWLEKLAAARIYMGDWKENTWEEIIGPWDKQVRPHATVAADWQKAKNRFQMEIGIAMREIGDAQGLKKWVDSYVHDNEIKRKYDSCIEGAKRDYPDRIALGGWMMAKGLKGDAPEEEKKRVFLERELEHRLDFINWFAGHYMKEDASGREMCVDNPQYWESILEDISQKQYATGQIGAFQLARASHGMAFTIYHFRAMDEYYRMRHADNK
jgi:hypothetical protein